MTQTPVNIDHWLIFTCSLLICTLSTLDLFAYDGDDPVPRLTTHPQVFKVARFPIKMPKFPGVQKGEPIFMTIKMFFGQTEIKIEVHIRDRVFTFTSAFETLEYGMHALNHGMRNMNMRGNEMDVSRASVFSSGTNSTFSNPDTISRPPSLGVHDYSTAPSTLPPRYPRSYRGDDEDTLDGRDSTHSIGFHGKLKDTFSKIAKRRQH